MNGGIVLANDRPSLTIINEARVDGGVFYFLHRYNDLSESQNNIFIIVILFDFFKAVFVLNACTE